jgi:ABC-type glycerol-3-phosphate transport system substrate-binding protein
MKHNKHSQHIPADILEQARAKVSEAVDLLKPYLIALTPAEGTDNRFNSIGRSGGWWSSLQSGIYSYEAYYWGMSNTENVYSNTGNKLYLRSVRCIKNLKRG